MDALLPAVVLDLQGHLHPARSQGLRVSWSYRFSLAIPGGLGGVSVRYAGSLVNPSICQRCSVSRLAPSLPLLPPEQRIPAVPCPAWHLCVVACEQRADSVTLINTGSAVAVVGCAVCPLPGVHVGKLLPQLTLRKDLGSLGKGTVVLPAAMFLLSAARAVPGACRPCPGLLSGTAGQGPGTARHRVGSLASQVPAHAARAGLAHASCAAPRRAHCALRAALLFDAGVSCTRMGSGWTRGNWDPRGAGAAVRR